MITAERLKELISTVERIGLVDDFAIDETGSLFGRISVDTGSDSSELVWDVLDLIHDYDWYASGDTCKETYLKKKDAFKKKWFCNRGVRVRRIVDDALKQAKEELYETFAVGDDLMERMVDDGK